MNTIELKITMHINTNNDSNKKDEIEIEQNKSRDINQNGK